MTVGLTAGISTRDGRWAANQRDIPDGLIGARDLCDRSGVSYRQLDWWTREGWLQTVGPPNPGTGATRCYRPQEVGVARLLDRLLNVGGYQRHTDWQDALRAACAFVRLGHRGLFELLPGVTLDLEVLCGLDD